MSRGLGSKFKMLEKRFEKKIIFNFPRHARIQKMINREERVFGCFLKEIELNIIEKESMR